PYLTETTAPATAVSGGKHTDSNIHKKPNDPGDGFTSPGSFPVMRYQFCKTPFPAEYLFHLYKRYRRQLFRGSHFCPVCLDEQQKSRQEHEGQRSHAQIGASGNLT